MTEIRYKAPRFEEDEDRPRLSLLPDIPDIVSYFVAFLLLWSIYTIVSRGMAYLEGVKEEHKKTFAEERAEQKKSLIELGHQVTGGVFRDAAQQGDSESVGAEINKIFEEARSAVTNLFDGSSSRRRQSENAF